MHQRARQGHALLFAAGEHVDRGVGRSPRPTRSSIARLRRRACAAAHAIQRQHQAHVLLHAERRQQVEELVDETDVAAAEQRALGLRQRRQVDARRRAPGRRRDDRCR